MKFSNEMLMAYADGELDLVARAEIEAAMAKDPAVAAAVERHRRVAARVRAAYEGIDDEPVPERLAALVRNPEAAGVVDLAARREAAGDRVGPDRFALPQWAALAATLALGLFVGLLVARGPGLPYEETGKGLVARGELDDALTRRLASENEPGEVRIGMSFRERGGAYCRTFHVERDAPLAGLACRTGEAWQIRVLAAARSHEGELRPAAAMPMAVLHAVDATMEGEPLDAAAEAAARNQDWRESPRSR